MLADYIGLPWKEDFTCADLVELYFQQEFGLEITVNRQNDYPTCPLETNAVSLMVDLSREWHVGVIIKHEHDLKLLHNYRPLGQTIISPLNSLPGLALKQIKYYGILS